MAPPPCQPTAPSPGSDQDIISFPRPATSTPVPLPFAPICPSPLGNGPSPPGRAAPSPLFTTPQYDPLLFFFLEKKKKKTYLRPLGGLVALTEPMPKTSCPLWARALVTS